MVNRCVIPECDQPASPPGRCVAHQQALARAIAWLWDQSPAGAAERARPQACAATPAPGRSRDRQSTVPRKAARVDMTGGSSKKLQSGARDQRFTTL